MSGVHPVLSADIGGLSLLIVAHTAPRPGEAWDPEDGPRPRNGVSAALIRTSRNPSCTCHGHETCYWCDLPVETEAGFIFRSGAHPGAWFRLLSALRADPRFVFLFEGGARFVGLFQGGGSRLTWVRRLTRRRSRALRDTGKRGKLRP